MSRSPCALNGRCIEGCEGWGGEWKPGIREEVGSDLRVAPGVPPMIVGTRAWPPGGYWGKGGKMILEMSANGVYRIMSTTLPKESWAK